LGGIASSKTGFYFAHRLDIRRLRSSRTLRGLGSVVWKSISLCPHCKLAVYLYRHCSESTNRTTQFYWTLGIWASSL